MKSPASLKTLGLCTLTALTLNAGLALADGRACPSAPVVAAAPASSPESARHAVYPQEVSLQMARIEQALRDGRITPYQAGQLMRLQWEIARYQQGFLASVQPTGSEGCNILPDIGAKLAPLGDMARNGMETASWLMRALLRETERLLREQPPEDKTRL
jgi:hypothetical protein